MTPIKDITFSLSMQSRDGDCIEHGVFLHFGHTTIKVAETVEEFQQIVPHMQSIADEMKKWS